MYDQNGKMIPLSGQTFSPQTTANVPLSLATFGADPFNADATTQVQGAQTTSSGNTGSGGTSNAAALASYDQAINNLQQGLPRLDNQFASGNQAIDTSYQNALNQLLLSKNQANNTYTTGLYDNSQSYVRNKNTVGSNAGSSLNGLLRLLGSRGAGGSSAAGVARDAVGRAASLQRGDVTANFAGNNRALDTNWNNYLIGYDNAVSSAGSQRDQERQKLASSIETNRANLLQQLAGLYGERAQAAGGNATAAAQPYLNQANSILDRQSVYTTNPINVNTQTYQAPPLSEYVAKQTVPGYTQQNGGDYVSPYLQALLGKKQNT